MSRTPAVLALMGPTAVGKTDLAIALARAAAGRFPVEIVSMDSALVYRGMDVGSGKPPMAQRAGIAHHLIDIRDPHQTYSAAEFAADARARVSEILSRDAVPLLVGGTGLYYRAFRYGLSPLPPANQSLRRSLESEARAHGWGALHRRLADVDPVAAARIRATDPQRVQRALEVYLLTGTPLSELHAAHAPKPCPWPVTAAALVPSDRGWLHQRIAQRFQAMLEHGLEREVHGLRARNSGGAALPAMRAVGYRQMLQYLDGELQWADMIQAAVVATRQLARRQLTWLRKEHLDAVWDPCCDGSAELATTWALQSTGL